MLQEPNKSLGVFGPSARRDSSVLYFVTFERKVECFGSSWKLSILLEPAHILKNINLLPKLFDIVDRPIISSQFCWQDILTNFLKKNINVWLINLKKKNILPFWVFLGCRDLAEVSLFSCISHPALTWTCWQTSPAVPACWWWTIRNYQSVAGSP